jgi:hypothetical protein
MSQRHTCQEGYIKGYDVMKTRSGVIRMPAGWPSLYQARALVPKDIQSVSQFVKVYNSFVTRGNSKKYADKRLLYDLAICEMILQYKIFIDHHDVQVIIEDTLLSLFFTNCPWEYLNQIRVLSEIEQTLARQAYVEFFFKGPLNADVARHIASFFVC